MTWDVTIEEEFSDAVLIEGLPGIANVGKIVVELLAEEFNAAPVASFHSPSISNAVLVREDNLIGYPEIEVKHFTHDDTDYLFLTGDTQPGENVDSHAFAEAVADYAAGQVREIVTLGGIGLKELPDDSDTYCTANEEEIHDRFADAGANPDTYGKVGPIMGITGLLIATADEQGIPAAALLGETLAHKQHVGLKAGRSVIRVLNEHYGFDVDTEDLDDQIADIEEQIKQAGGDFDQVQRAEEHPEMSYIG